jgi:outer membrane protein OmpA-like peptidoglycan-associated protein
LLAVLGAALLGFYLFSHQPAISPSIGEAPAIQAAATAPPRLTLSNDNGVIRYTGTVHDEAARMSILNALTTAFGVSNIQGSIAIDPNRTAAPWAGNLRAALESLRAPGAQLVFEGNPAGVGGIGEALGNIMSGANSRVMAALAALKAGFSTSELTGILNQSMINFPSAESQVPTAALGLLASAAAQIKQLPANTVLEIAGYTDNVGDPSANLTLSQQRAEAVRSELVRNGVAASMLVAKGYGDAKPIASNDSAEGRFRNRRIEYHVLQP